MAHFAQLDENNVVIAINVIADSDCLDSEGNESEAVGIAFCKTLWGDNTIWKQTSYNTQIGKRWKTNNEGTADEERVEDTDKTQFRKNFAQIGYTYDEGRDAFILPQPFPSWTLNESMGKYEAPTPYPHDDEGDFIPNYEWDEDKLEWVYQG